MTKWKCSCEQPITTEDEMLEHLRKGHTVKNVPKNEEIKDEP